MKEPDPFSLAVALARLAEALLRLSLLLALALPVLVVAILGAIPFMRGVSRWVTQAYARLAVPLSD